MEDRILFHGSTQIVEHPEIINSKFNKDFYLGFYATILYEQAERLATRFTGKGFISEYIYKPNEKLKILKFERMTEEWLDFVVDCRLGKKHDYDIVEGPMANDTIYNFVQDFADGKISRAAFWELAKFKRPTHQISFNTKNALTTIEFKKGYRVDG